MYILWALIIRLGVGAMAKLLLPGGDLGGLTVTSTVGSRGLAARHLPWPESRLVSG